MATIGTSRTIAGYLPWNDPTIRTWLAALALSGVVLFGLIGRLGLASVEWVAVLAVLSVLFIRWSGAPIVLFVLISATIFWSTQLGRLSLLSAAESALGAVFLACAGLHFRLWQSIRRIRRSGHQGETAATGSRLWAEVCAVVAVAIASALLARASVGYLYVGLAMYEDFGLSPLVAQFLFGILVCGSVVLLLVAIVRTLSRRRWNRLEAEMVLNEETYSLLLAELRRLSRRRRR